MSQWLKESLDSKRQLENVRKEVFVVNIKKKFIMETDYNELKSKA